jgi:hypothetical protein
MKVEQPKHDNDRLARFSLWTSFFLPPIAWSVHLLFVYAAAQQVCQENLTRRTLIYASIACLVVALAGGALGAVHWFVGGREMAGRVALQLCRAQPLPVRRSHVEWCCVFPGDYRTVDRYLLLFAMCLLMKIHDASNSI